MMRVRLHRTAHGADGVFGMMVLRDMPLCVTCENPWLENRRNVSCIPPGVYSCAAYSSQKYRNVWQVLDVPGRSAILIHAGNTIRDTRGCILPGLTVGSLSGLPAVLRSAAALKRLRTVLDESFYLEVTG